MRDNSELPTSFKSTSKRVHSLVSFKSSLEMGLGRLSPKGLLPNAPIWALIDSPPSSPRAKKTSFFFGRPARLKYLPPFVSAHHGGLSGPEINATLAQVASPQV